MIPLNLIKESGRRLAAAAGLFIAIRRRGYIYFSGEDIWRPGRIRREGDTPFKALANPVVDSGRTLLDYDRLYVLWQVARNVASMGLAAAEVGSYRGGSAYFIASALEKLSGCKTSFHVFDTFEGHPDKITEFDSVHEMGMFSDTDYEDVKSYLSPLPQVVIHKGEFSKSVEGLDDQAFGMAHIDVDIYQTTLDCLRYFGERLVPGGIMVVDDYYAPKCPGVRKAVAEFLDETTRYQSWDLQTRQLILTSR